MSKFTNRLEAAMRGAGSYPAQLSRDLGKHRTFINRVLAGDTSGGASVVDMARLLKVEVAWLATGAVAARPSWLTEAEAAELSDTQIATPTAPMSTLGTSMAVQQLAVIVAHLEAQVRDLLRTASEKDAKIASLVSELEALRSADPAARRPGRGKR